MSKVANAMDVVPVSGLSGAAKPERTPFMHTLVMTRRVVPFLIVHLATISVLFVAFSWWAVVLCAAVYSFLQIGSGGWLHRYFSHRCFRTSRAFQFVLAFWGGCCAQRGALWWAAHHRRHHAYSDKEHDPHSPHTEGFWHAHVSWIWEDEFQETDHRWVKDLARYPELQFLDKFYWVPVLVFWCAISGLGAAVAPAIGLTALQGALTFFAWGAILGTVLAWHATFAINSLTHLWGKKRYATDDESRNSMMIALFNFGEGWHNNHHYYPYAGNSGFYWWEIDPPYYLMIFFEKIGLVWDLKRTPKKAIEGHKYRVDQG